MQDLPVIGAQLTVLDLDRHIGWLREKDRDLELPEFALADILAKPEPFIAMAKKKLDGWKGRLGIHGPFSGFGIDVKDREIRAIVQARLDQGLSVCAALGATQMVIHSPYNVWDRDNLDQKPGERGKRIGAMLDTLAPALKRAEDQGVVMVVENIEDTDPADRMALIEAAASPALRLSVDTGHAHWAHTACGAPPADRFIQAAGAMLDHIHLQDTDGHADRHWPLGEGNISWHGVFRAINETRRAGANPRLIIEINEFEKVRQAAEHLVRLGVAE